MTTDIQNPGALQNPEVFNSSNEDSIVINCLFSAECIFYCVREVPSIEVLAWTCPDNFDLSEPIPTPGGIYTWVSFFE